MEMSFATATSMEAYFLSLNGEKIELDIGSCLLFSQEESFFSCNGQSTFEMPFSCRFHIRYVECIHFINIMNWVRWESKTTLEPSYVTIKSQDKLQIPFALCLHLHQKVQVPLLKNSTHFLLCSLSFLCTHKQSLSKATFFLCNKAWKTEKMFWFDGLRLSKS